MSDLIKREDVIQTLKETGIIQDNDLGHCVIDEIKRIPTAYDKEAVIEQLEKLTNNYEEGCTDRIRKGLCFKADDCGRCAFLQSIDIVKAGGIDG